MNVTSYLIEAHICRKINDKIEYLILKRSETDTYPNIWQMVTGSISENEKAYEAALREIKEETALIPKKLWVIPFVNSFYSFQKDLVCLVPVFCAEVDAFAQVKISDEHSLFKWVDINEAKSKFAWDGQRKSLEIIDEYLTVKNSFLHFTEIPIAKK